jgi:2-oxoisovalerate dehydrogenase E1 component
MEPRSLVQSTQVEVDWTHVTRLVLRSRALDDLEEAELAPSGEVAYQFSAKGHELAQVLLALQLDHAHDAATTYYRSRPFALASGVTLVEALAAGMARTGGPSEGRDAGVIFSMQSRGGATILPASGDVGSQYTPAAGWAQAIRYHARVLGDNEWAGSIAVGLGGDGSVASSGFWSALTIATTLRLPMLFFIEDNGYGLSVPSRLQTPGGDISANLASFKGLKIFSGSGTDPEQASTLVEAAVAHVRSGEGSCLLRLTVPRLSGHTFVDNQAYKSEARKQEEASRDPLRSLEERLGDETIARIRDEVDKELRQALDEARSKAEPDPESAVDRVFFDGRLQQIGGVTPAIGAAERPATESPILVGPRVNLIESVRAVMEQELKTNERAVLFGEDVGLKGGVHGATMGLQARFGDERVFDTSLSEEGIIGRSIGMALAGLLPIPEIQFRKYADPATEQIHNAGTLRWRTAGKFAVPMVVRIPLGHGKKIGDPWHSVSGESFFVQSLGWRVAFPSNAADAAGLFRAALRGQDPTVFLEHRALLDGTIARRPDPGPDYVLPFGRAATLTTGTELTLITWGAMVYPCLEVAEGFSGRVELIDLRTIVPWDRESVLGSISRTGKALVVHEEPITSGFGAEIVATLAESAFGDLDAPIRRLAVPDCPIPFNAGLMRQVLPNVDTISRVISELLDY